MMRIDDLVADLVVDQLGLTADLDVLELLFDFGVGRQGASSSSTALPGRALCYVCR
jgi:hypothetical protein